MENIAKLNNIIKKSLVLGCLLILSNNALAKLQNIEDAPVAVKVSSKTLVNSNGSRDILEDVEYTGLTTEGSKYITEFDFKYSKFDTFQLIKAEYYLPNSTKAIQLDKSMIDTKMAANQEMGLSSNMQTSISFPNVQKGTRVHYIVNYKLKAKGYFKEFYDEWRYQPSNTRVDAYKASFITQKPLYWKAKNIDDFIVTQTKNKKNISISLKKIPYYKNYINESSNAILLEYPRIALSHSLDLQHNYAQMAKRYVQLLKQPLPEKLKTVVLANQDKSDPEKISVFMQYIYKNFRYIADSRAFESGHIPFNLAKIANSGYGDCKNLSVLLIAMLKAAHIKAEPVIIYRGVLADKPLMDNFLMANHMIVRAQIGAKEQVIWLDPTNPFFYFGKYFQDIADRDILVISQDGKVRQENIPTNKMTKTSLSEDMTITKQDESAQIHINYKKEIEPADINMFERTQGADTVNNYLCQMASNQYIAGSCIVKRPQADFFLKNNYSVEIDLKDARALKEIAPNSYLYKSTSNFQKWDALISYKNNAELLDLFLGEVHTKNNTVNVKGYQIETNRSCSVKSKWFELAISAKSTADGTQIHYQEQWKVPILRHDDIISAEFQNKVHAARTCLLQSNLLID